MSTSSLKIENSTIYVGGIDDSIDEEAIYNAFIPFGKIVEITIPKRNEQEDRNFCFVEFEELPDAKAAVDNMHMSMIFGLTIRCNLSRPSHHIRENITTEPIWSIEAKNEGINYNKS